MESKLQGKCVKLAQANKILIRKVHAENRKGFPDLLLIFPITGKTVYVEMKHPNGKGTLAKLQERELDRIRKQNASAYECDSYDKFAEIIKTHLRAEFREV
tara:strand:+ start:2930 stop:3232 length:303 start_codon:yes stop_codon:yes gene_type:complete